MLSYFHQCLRIEIQAFCSEAGRLIGLFCMVLPGRDGTLHLGSTSRSSADIPFSPQFESEEQFNISVSHLLSRLPKQRYLKSICDEIHRLKMVKK